MKNFYLILIASLLATACNTADVKEITVVPYPNEVSVENGSFNAAGADVTYDANFHEFAKDAITSFAEQLSLVSGKQSEISEGTSSRGFVFVLDQKLPKEAYTLDISKKAAIIEASSLNGVIYAIQTMKQMLPVEIYGKTSATDKDWSISCCRIEDAPRFAYRGEHLDEARYLLHGMPQELAFFCQQFLIDGLLKL